MLWCYCNNENDNDILMVMSEDSLNVALKQTPVLEE